MKAGRINNRNKFVLGPSGSGKSFLMNNIIEQYLTYNYDAVSYTHLDVYKRQDYWDPIKLILKAVGGLVGFIGGLRVYNKWTNGDQDVNKEILGYGGAMIFLIVVPEFVTAFFA